MTNNDTLAPVDPLGEALHSLRMSGTLYFRSELSAPWALPYLLSNPLGILNLEKSVAKKFTSDA